MSDSMDLNKALGILADVAKKHEARLNALEARVVAPTQDTALSILNQENEHLRAEIATLKALNAGQHAANVAQPAPAATLPPYEIGGANPEWEEDRLRDAVVDAALAWAEALHNGGDVVLTRLAFVENVGALHAHRAKKGGA